MSKTRNTFLGMGILVLAGSAVFAYQKLEAPPAELSSADKTRYHEDIQKLNSFQQQAQPVMDDLKRLVIETEIKYPGYTLKIDSGEIVKKPEQKK